MSQIIALLKAKILVPVAMAVASGGLAYARNYRLGKPTSWKSMLVFILANIFLMALFLEGVRYFSGAPINTFQILVGVAVGVFSPAIWDSAEKFVKINLEGINEKAKKFWDD